MAYLPDLRPDTTQQIQCPVCHSYGATSSLTLLDPRTEKAMIRFPFADRLVGLLSIFAFAYILFGLFGTSTLTCGLTVALGLGVTMALALWSNLRQERAVRIHTYTCRTCHHSWSLREGGT